MVSGRTVWMNQLFSDSPETGYMVLEKVRISFFLGEILNMDMNRIQNIQLILQSHWKTD